MFVKINSKGQITLPESLLADMNLMEGDTIAVSRRDEGIWLIPVRGTIFDLRGSVPVDGPQDWDEVREKARQHVAEKVMRDLRESSSSSNVD